MGERQRNPPSAVCGLCLTRPTVLIYLTFVEKGAGLKFQLYRPNYLAMAALLIERSW